MRTTRVDDLNVRWDELGAGAPVVMIHGIPTCPALWRHVVDRIDGARVLLWEMVGYGQSWREGISVDISVAAQAGYLLGWLDSLAIPRAIFVGHDLGGGVAQIAAVRDPSRCAGLVLCNSICYDSWPIPSVRAMRALGPLVERTPASVMKRALSAFIGRGHDQRDRAKESADVHTANYDHSDGPTAFVRQIRSLRTEDTLAVAPTLRTLDVPSAVVWGVADRFQKVGYGRRLAEDLRTEIDEVPGGKHFVPEDHPERMAAAVMRVIQQAHL